MALRILPNFELDSMADGEAESEGDSPETKKPRTYFPETWLWDDSKSGCVVLHVGENLFQLVKLSPSRYFFNSMFRKYITGNNGC